MLAATCGSTAALTFPLYASPKLDGVRGVITGGSLRSRSLKRFPNPFVHARFSSSLLEGLDGELILGSPTAKDVYRVTNGACARGTGEPDVKFFVFDDFSKPERSFEDRLMDVVEHDHCVLVMHERIIDEVRLLEYEAKCLDLGYEGLILRSPDGLYKFGRSTLREGGMIKLKRFADDEAEVVGVYEEMHNENMAQTNELGRTFRSSDAAGLVGKGVVGGFLLRTKANVLFKCGTGITDADGVAFWKLRRKGPPNHVKLETETLAFWPLKKKAIAKYKHFPVGAKDKPRHPVYLGLRMKEDT